MACSLEAAVRTIDGVDTRDEGADANPFISQLISHEQVNHVTSQTHIFSAYGPVLAMYPSVIDLGDIMRATGTTALCVIRGDDLTLWSKK